MEIFIKQTGIDTISYNKFISCKTASYKIKDETFFLYTFTPKLKRNQSEDTLFISNPFLVSILPRACTYIVKNDVLITRMEGCCKFTGFSNIDEDPENNDTIGIKNNNLFDFSIIEKWHKSGDLAIVMTEKANGKFAILKIFGDTIVCGSKNYHIIFNIKDIDDVILKTVDEDIMYKIIVDIKKNIEPLMSIIKIFDDGYSLVGELCDGQHFTRGDNTISWFGFFRNGLPMESITALSLLSEHGIKTVNYTKILDSTSNIALSSVFKSARCLSGEGYVFYCRNTKNNKTILVKVKAVGYIVKRITRQVLLRGYKNIYDIATRIIETRDYHNLNTQAAIRITNILINFGMWMMDKKYPVSALGHMTVVSVKGKIENGFFKFWNEYIEEVTSTIVGRVNLNITESDFSHSELFNPVELLKNVDKYTRRSHFNPVLVIFLQGLQGSGKSTLASRLCEKFDNTIYLEQDMFWGDTMSCQGALYHNIANADGPDIIIMSRCNMNETHYGRYLRICNELPTKTIFIAPEQMNEMDIMISIQGVINRSNNGDLMMFGRTELSLEDAVKRIIKNFTEYTAHPSSFRIITKKDDSYLLTQFKKNRITNTVINFAKNNIESLKSLRIPMDNIVEQVSVIINNVLYGNNASTMMKIITPLKPSFVGLFLSDEDKAMLSRFVDSFVSDENMTLFNEHLTLSFKPHDLTTQVKPNEIVKLNISRLVIRKSDRAAAFLVKRITVDGKRVILDNPHLTPHITAKIPDWEKPDISRQFVGLTDDSVEVILVDKIVSAICVWVA